MHPTVCPQKFVGWKLSALAALAVVFGMGVPLNITQAAEPQQGDAKPIALGGDVSLEVVYIPPGEFTMGSTPEERAWATGIEGGAAPGTARETYEGEARPARIKHGFWMGRTEVSVGQFSQFAKDSGYVTDAEKPGGHTQCFDPEWDGYHLTTKVSQPWKPMPGKRLQKYIFRTQACGLRGGRGACHAACYLPRARGRAVAHRKRMGDS